MKRRPSLLTKNPPAVIIFDAWEIFTDLMPSLRDYLNDVYETTLPADTVEGFTLHELRNWWSIVNLETMWCLPMVPECVFPGSAQLRHALESCSYKHSSLLYLSTPIGAVVEDRLVKITPRQSSITIEFR